VGKSYTIAVIGMTKETKNKTQEIFYAMSRTEMAQEKIKAERRGQPIVVWYAQTQAGCRMLGATSPYVLVPDHAIKHINLVKCPVCQGQGSTIISTGPGLPQIYGCPVCNSAGYTQRNHWNKWNDWQIKEMQTRFREEASHAHATQVS
jgi:hypothetical protein